MPAAPTNNADAIQESVRAKLAAALTGQTHDWNVYSRRDLNELHGDTFPAVYCVNLAEQILEEESDNRQLVAYPIAVVLIFPEAIVDRDQDPDLVSLRRVCQQAVYTTRYDAFGAPPVAVELVTIQESVGLALPTLEQGRTATAFGVTVGVCERRTTAENYP